MEVRIKDVDAGLTIIDELMSRVGVCSDELIDRPVRANELGEVVRGSRLIAFTDGLNFRLELEFVHFGSGGVAVLFRDLRGARTGGYAFVVYPDNADCIWLAEWLWELLWALASSLVGGSGRVVFEGLDRVGLEFVRVVSGVLGREFGVRVSVSCGDSCVVYFRRE